MQRRRQTRKWRCQMSLEEAKKEVILQFTKQVNGLSSFKELEAIKKIIVPIKPTIDALNYQKDMAFPSTSRIPSNKKNVPQRNFFCTKKGIKTKRSKLLKPSPVAANMLAVRALNDRQ